MTDDRALLDALRADPADNARWLVYADWLDDHSDPRGEYIRLVLELALATYPDPDRRRRLNAVRPTLPRDWLAEVEQPAVIRANPTPYDFYWRGYPLDVRSVDVAYTIEEYRTLPPVPVGWIARFEDWFTGLADRVRVRRRELPGEEYFRAEETEAAISSLSTAANDFGLTLPDRFADFFADDCHPLLFPSDSYDFNLPERIVPAPECPEAGLIRFYSDCQGTKHWYLYLTPEGDECVVASDAYVGGDSARPQTDDRWYENDSGVGMRFSFCAPSFAEFIARSWLENMAWYSLHPEYAGPTETRGAQAPEVRAYLDHYRKSH